MIRLLSLFALLIATCFPVRSEASIIYDWSGTCSEASYTVDTGGVRCSGVAHAVFTLSDSYVPVRRGCARTTRASSSTFCTPTTPA